MADAPSKEEKESAFIEAIEQILGGRLMEWQKPLLLQLRKQIMSGKPIEIEVVPGHLRKVPR